MLRINDEISMQINLAKPSLQACKFEVSWAVQVKDKDKVEFFFFFLNQKKLNK